MGQGFGGFLDLCEKVFFLNAMHGGCLTPAGQVFIVQPKKQIRASMYHTIPSRQRAPSIV